MDSMTAVLPIRSDTSFNPACDPQGPHTSDGQHTSTYCNAWTSGYTSTWNSQYTTTPTDTFNQRQESNTETKPEWHLYSTGM